MEKTKGESVYKLSFYITCIITGLFIMTSGATSLAGDGPWILSKQKNGVIVEYRKVSGSKYNALKGTSFIPANIESIVKVLEDVGAYTQWMPNCMESPVLKPWDKNGATFYLAQNLPWPVSDRDVVLNVTEQRKTSDGNVLIHMVSVNNHSIPEKAERVRMAFFECTWLLEPVSQNQTRVMISMHGDPAGSMSSIAANFAGTGVIYDTILGLMTEVKTNQQLSLAKHNKKVSLD